MTLLRSVVRWLPPVGLLLSGAPSAYLVGLSAASARRHRCGLAHDHRFVIVIPAHNEADTLAPTLESLSLLAYPADRYDVVVVADNCTDSTADVARGAWRHRSRSGRRRTSGEGARLALGVQRGLWRPRRTTQWW